MNKLILLHIGFGKTGTTTIQHQYFDQISGVNYIGKPRINQNSDLKSFIEILVGRETLEYNHFYDKFHEWVWNHLIYDSSNIISAEVLSSGSFLLPGNVDRYAIAYRLKSLFPTAKVLITIRNQFEILKSVYTQRIKRKRTTESFLEWLNTEYLNLHHNSIFHMFSFYPLYNLYEQLWGKNNIKCLAQEQLDLNPEWFFSQINDFANLTSSKKVHASKDRLNMRPSKRELKAKTLLQRNRIMTSVVKHVPASLKRIASKAMYNGKPIDTKYTFEWEEFIRAYYSEENYLLELKTGLPLTQWGYPMKQCNTSE